MFYILTSKTTNSSEVCLSENYVTSHLLLIFSLKELLTESFTFCRENYRHRFVIVHSWQVQCFTIIDEILKSNL